MKTPITVRIEAELLAKVRRCAREENRTLTNFIETVLRQRVARSVPGTSSEVPFTPVIGHTKDKTCHGA